MSSSIDPNTAIRVKPTETPNVHKLRVLQQIVSALSAGIHTVTNEALKAGGLERQSDQLTWLSGVFPQRSQWRYDTTTRLWTYTPEV